MGLKNGPPWYDDVTLPQFPKLSEPMEADVCIIGGGLCGLLSAYLLAKNGKKVVLLEKDRIGSGATGMTTGFLTQAIDNTELSDLITIYGTDKTQQIVDSHTAGTNLIEKIAREENIECEFERTSLFVYAGRESESKSIEKERGAVRELSLSVGETSKIDIPNFGFLEIKNEAKFHPLKFLAGLAMAASSHRAKLFENTEATEITGDTPSVQTKDASVRAESIISATYSPFKEPASLFLKKAMYVTYLFELEVQKGALMSMMYEDEHNPYHYIRVDPKETHDRVIVGGEDHRADIPIDQNKNFLALKDFVAYTFANIDYRIVRRWKGPILEPIDGLAFIGALDNPRIQYAFGFSGSGMTYSPIAAAIMSEHILGKKHPWSDLYAVSRIPTATSLLFKGKDYGGELIGGALKNALFQRGHDRRSRSK